MLNEEKEVNILVVSDPPTTLLFVSHVKHRDLKYMPGIALSTLHVLTHLILLTSPSDRFYYCYHFIDTEARQRGFSDSPEVTASKWQNLD